jgi:hypothetical protein
MTEALNLKGRKVGEVGMSMYGESEYAGEKNYLFDEIRRFLEEGHPVEDLIRIVADAIEYSH